MLKLTQCMIVKNEEHNLARALGWGKNVVDEQIIVDTGSTDGTVTLAKELGAAVFHFRWNNDFAAARNFAISKCTGQWILFLDADEYFEEKEIPLLRPLIERLNGQYPVIDGKKRRYNVIETPWVNMGTGNVARQSRIFRNVPFLRYKGTVHEMLYAQKGGYIAAYPVKDAPAICHTGYVWSDENPSEAKGARNFEAAVKGLEEAPDSAKLKLYAAEALMLQNKLAESERYFVDAMKNCDGSISPVRLREGYKQWLSLYMLMQQSGADVQGLISAAACAHAQAVAGFPEEPDYDMLVCQLYLKANRIDSAICSFENAMSKMSGKELRGPKKEGYKNLFAAFEQLKKSLPEGDNDAAVLFRAFSTMK